MVEKLDDHLMKMGKGSTGSKGEQEEWQPNFPLPVLQPVQEQTWSLPTAQTSMSYIKSCRAESAEHFFWQIKKNKIFYRNYLKIYKQRRKETTMDQNTINRINELARKSKGEGLTLEEKEEQRKLRAEYIAAIRMNMRAQLDNIDIQEKRWNDYQFR